MSPSRKNASAGAGDALPADVAGQEAERASAQSNKALSRVNLVLRVLLFALACISSTIGVLMLLNTINTQTVSRAVTVASMRGEPVCHALVLMSYDESDANVAYERDGVLDVLNRANISSDIVYMDARSTAGNATAERRVTEQIEQKAALAEGYDAVIVAGDDALAYVEEHQELFGGLPVAFFGVDDTALANRVQAAGIGTGFVEGTSVTSIVGQVQALVPAAGRGIVLVDGSMEADGMLDQLTAEASKTNPKVRVERDVWDVSTMTRDKLASRLGELDKDTFVLLLAANRDSAGAVFTPSETAHFLKNASPVPVFSVTGGVGEGVCGSTFIDSAEEGMQAATLAVDLLNGKKAAEVPVQTVDPVTMVFDAAALSSYGIDANDVPGSYTLINEPAFSWRAISPYVPPIICLIMAVICIAGFGFIGFRRSVQSTKAIISSRNDLQHRLYHDLLTDLPNRHGLEQYVRDHVSGSKSNSMVQIDIDDFTDLNDSYGHALANEILCEVSKRLKGIDASILARSGGDEFTLVFDHALSSGCQELSQLAKVFGTPFKVGDNAIELSYKAGIANSDAGLNGDGLMMSSNLALKNAKETHANHPVFYSDAMREGMEKKLEITSCLRSAVSDEGVYVLWQPQVDTETLEVVGYEALCRLVGDKYYPNDFIPVAEMSGLIVPLDRSVTKIVVEQLGAWIKEGRTPGFASINFSAAQLRDRGYCDYLAQLLKENNVPGKLIKIEITESMILGNEDLAEELFARLLEMDVTLALDDFGTGYSSLSRMANTPVDYVKLDKSLVDTFMVEGKEGFIEHVVELVHGLDKHIVVEGIETYSQYEMAKRLGCDVIQGYFFSRPVSASEAIQFHPGEIGAKVSEEAEDKTRNSDWKKYDRDSRGRWTKKSHSE